MQEPISNIRCWCNAKSTLNVGIQLRTWQYITEHSELQELNSFIQKTIKQVIICETNVWLGI
jgi:hypothetical protein